MEIIEKRLSDILERYHLLKHPFYKSWAAGTLDPDKLKSYSAEYGTFIQKIAMAWESCGFDDIADIEKSHAIMWADFAKSLKTNIPASPNIKEVEDLNEFMEECSKDKAKALGALLAFECQQPDTVESKLKGLRDHYSHLKCDETYFIAHIDDWDEPEMLKNEIHKLDKKNTEVSIDAFEKSCQHLWNSLSGIHGEC